jgi:hypothetical protein
VEALLSLVTFEIGARETPLRADFFVSLPDCDGFTALRPDDLVFVACDFGPVFLVFKVFPSHGTAQWQIYFCNDAYFQITADVQSIRWTLPAVYAVLPAIVF